MSIYPSQLRSIDPFRDYNSNAVNELTRMITRGSGKSLIHGYNSLDVSRISTTNLQLSTGQCFKDDVLIEFDAIFDIDCTDVTFYPQGGTPLDEDGYYYVVLDYTYAKVKPAPEASIQILRPSERSLLTTNDYLLLKVFNSTSGSIQTTLYDYDPDTPSVVRTYTDAFVGVVETLPIFDATNDIGRLLLEKETKELYYGTQETWVSFSSAHTSIDTTSSTLGQLIYIDHVTAQVLPAIATSNETLAAGGVIGVGEAETGDGKILIFGKLLNVPIEGALIINNGDKLYLSDTTAGSVTTVPTSSYTQFVGTSVSPNGTTSNVDMWLVPNLKGSGGASGGGDITREDLLYHTLLTESSYELCFYDIFPEDGTVTVSGATYDFQDTLYSGVNTDYIITPELVADATTTLNTFLFHIESDNKSLFTLEYDIGTGYVSFNPSELIEIDGGFTSLVVRITWTGTTNLESFGCVYQNLGVITTTTPRLFEAMIIPGGGYSALTTITIPNNARYTTDNESLEIYRNGVRLIVGEHYTELNERQIEIIDDWVENDYVLFTEFYGLVDYSFENKQIVDNIIDGIQPQRTKYNIIIDDNTAVADYTTLEDYRPNAVAGDNVLIRNNQILTVDGFSTPGDVTIEFLDGVTITYNGEVTGTDSLIHINTNSRLVGPWNLIVNIPLNGDCYNILNFNNDGIYVENMHIEINNPAGGGTLSIVAYIQSPAELCLAKVSIINVDSLVPSINYLQDNSTSANNDVQLRVKD